ncbi:MAG TPA: class I SAM-dependent methyltransferase [Solirubrobacteraceae bacterium]|nr:class I SAM-dependent methyltransferase [Solirubrobacteraceae bacterium]
MREALALYGRVLVETEVTSGPLDPLVRFEDGTSLPFPVTRYLAPADRLDQLLLDEIAGPVLDVGCGPGRHLQALSARGVYALGVDLSEVAVKLARGGGARAIVADIFDELPLVGRWRTALLLDGNIGIGGDPVRLLSRVRSLLRHDGVALVELGSPGSANQTARARLELAGESSDWFPWASLAADEVAGVACEAGMSLEQRWSCAGRWFAWLQPTG